jgi:hypothetical protein
MTDDWDKTDPCTRCGEPLGPIATRTPDGWVCTSCPAKRRRGIKTR